MTRGILKHEPYNSIFKIFEEMDLCILMHNTTTKMPDYYGDTFLAKELKKKRI